MHNRTHFLTTTVSIRSPDRCCYIYLHTYICIYIQYISQYIYMYPSLYIYPSLLISLAKCVQAMLKICGFAGHFLQKSPTLSVDCRTNLKDKHKGMQCICLLSPFLFVSFLCMQRWICNRVVYFAEGMVQQEFVMHSSAYMYGMCVMTQVIFVKSICDRCCYMYLHTYTYLYT